MSDVPPGARYRGDGCDREAVDPAHPTPRCSRHLPDGASDGTSPEPDNDDAEPAAAVDGEALHKPTEQPRLSGAGGE